MVPVLVLGVLAAVLALGMSVGFVARVRITGSAFSGLGCNGRPHTGLLDCGRGSSGCWAMLTALSVW
jgi:hypothetical protein